MKSLASPGSRASTGLNSFFRFSNMLVSILLNIKKLFVHSSHGRPFFDRTDPHHIQKPALFIEAQQLRNLLVIKSSNAATPELHGSCYQIQPLTQAPRFQQRMSVCSNAPGLLNKVQVSQEQEVKSTIRKPLLIETS